MCIPFPFARLFDGFCAKSVFADTAAVEKLFATAVAGFLIFRELFGESVSTWARVECDEGLLMETVNDVGCCTETNFFSLYVTDPAVLLADLAPFLSLLGLEVLDTLSTIELVSF